MGRNGLGGGAQARLAPILLATLMLAAALGVSLAQDTGATAGDDPVQAGREVPATGRYVEIRGLIDWFQRGGIFMYPLLAASILGIGVIIERLIAVRRATGRTRQLIGSVLETMRRDGPVAAREVCRKSGAPAARILHAGLSRIGEGPARVERAMEVTGSVEVAFLQRGLLWLSTVANVTPLLGFLGTVSGMIHAFATIAGADQISARLVAGGIEEALITTEAGLSIAIPVQAFHNYLVGRIDRFITEMEEGSLDLVAALDRPEGPA